jgi:hypothetical protein
MLKLLLPLLLLAAPLSNAGAQSAPPMRPLIEELRIDGSAHEWKQIKAIRSGPAGHILVGEAIGKSIRLFSPSGQLVRTLGRPGQGPGEFLNASTFGTLGDTIWAGDGGLNRVTFFALSGNVLGTMRTDSGLMRVRDSTGKVVHIPRMSAAAPVVLYRDGTALVIPTLFATDADTLGNSVVYPYWRTTWRGRVIDTAVTGLLENPMVRIMSRDGTRRNFIQNPFPQREQVGVSVDGRRLAVASAAFTGRDAWSYSVRLSDAAGRELYRRRFPFSRAQVPGRVIDSLAAELRTRYRNYLVPREVIPAPPSYPPVSKVLVATDGSVWLRGRDDPAGATWTILDPRGDPVATVREPQRTRFIEIDAGLWAIERDEDDVESIVRYRVGNP